MSAMSRVERAFCCGALWRTGTGAVVRSLPPATLGREVLEIGSGSGAIAERLAREHPDIALTATDLDPVMVSAAADRLGDAPNTTVRTADATALPFADASFDSVVTALALCSLPDPRGAIAEMTRVLVPGGRLLLLDHVRSTWPPLVAGQWLVERITIPVAGEHFTRRQLPLVKAAGLEIVETMRSKAGTIERIHARKPAAG